MLRAILFVSALAVVAVVAQHPRAETAQAAFPGENGRLAVSAFTDTRGGIALVDPDTGSREFLTDEFSDNFPAVSPDGSQIAFQRGGGVAGSDIDLWVVNADGTGLRQLTDGEPNDRSPAWSPDGSKIVFSRSATGQAPTLVVVNAEDGGGLTQLTDPSEFASDPSWSPDGTTIVYRGFPLGGTTALYTVPSGGGAPQVIPNTVGAGTPDWSPDGRKIAYAKPPSGSSNFQIFTQSITPPGPPIQLTTGNHTVAPAWSPDGTKIAYTPATPFNLTTTWVMNVNGSDQHQVAENAVSPDWQPLPTLIDEVEFTQAAQVVQSIPALKADLAADGAPPVPIVAGKPAAMRVMFKETDDFVRYIVDSNVTAEDVRVNLGPGCDAFKRRSQKEFCESVDFHFVPPVGDYEIDLFVKAENGDILEEYTFELTSVQSQPLTLVAVSVCDSRLQAYVWDCGDSTRVAQLLTFLKAVVPTDSVQVYHHPTSVFREPGSAGGTGRTWWRNVLNDLDAIYESDQAAGLVPPGRVIYVGAVRPGGPGGALGMARLDGQVAAIKTQTSPQGVDDTPETLAHEVGHALGLPHTGTGLPASTSRPGCYSVAEADDAAAFWPHLDNFLYTTGFDVLAGEAKPGSEWFELMGYCGPQWVSVESSLGMLAELRAPAASNAAGTPAGVGDGVSWLVSGEIVDSAANFGPLLTIEAGAGAEDEGAGEFRLEVQGEGGAVLFTRDVALSEGQTKAEPGVPDDEGPRAFTEVIPVQAGAQLIALMQGASELGAIELTGDAPTVAFDSAPGGAASGEQLVTWTITDADSGEHTSRLEYSTDGGTSWQTIATGLTENGVTVDFDALSGASNATLRVRVSDGVNTGTATSEPFTVAEKGPEASIVAPENGSAYRVTEIVGLQAVAFDPEGDVTVTWSSNKDGNLGAGATLPVEGLSAGTHTITMTARDSDNNSVSDTITVTVSDLPLVEGEEPGVDHIWGDNDCNGAITTRDNQALLRNILQQQPLSQTQPCPALGDVVSVGGASVLWGDLDCNGAIGARDGQALLRNVLGQPPLSQTQPCPAIGDSVAVGALSFSRRLFGKVAHQPPGLRAFGDPFVPG